MMRRGEEWENVDRGKARLVNEVVVVIIGGMSPGIENSLQAGESGSEEYGAGGWVVSYPVHHIHLCTMPASITNP